MNSKDTFMRNYVIAVRKILMSEAEIQEQPALKSKEEDTSSAVKSNVECPLCGSLQDRKAVGLHMNEKCSKRVVECNFCNGDFEAWEKQSHEASCRHRPGTCEHCQKKFSTVAELEDLHYPRCPEMPVKCTFHELGCPFVAPRREVPSHELTSPHTAILAAQILQLKAENENLRQQIKGRRAT